MKLSTTLLLIARFAVTAQAAPANLDEASAFATQGLNHLAWQSYAQALTGGVSPKMQRQALERMLEIRKSNPTFTFTAEMKTTLRQLAAQTQDETSRTLIHEAALALLTEQLATGADASSTMGLFSTSPAYQAYAQGMVAAAQGKHTQAIEALERFLKSNSLPESLMLERDNARLLVARAHYALGNYGTAATAFAKVSTRAPEFAESLVGRGWSELQAGHYPEALGAAKNFEMGAMKSEFQPEALMIKAMGLNELCQFPESLKSVRQFQQSYRDSYLWLKQWAAQTAATQPLLYPLAMAAVKGTLPKGVPAPLARVWSRSATFLAEQTEIHALFQEEASARAALSHRPANAQAIKAFADRAAEMRKQATARINRELAAINQSLLKRLDTSAENLSLVQVEIYNGASHDMIFRNANPKFAELSDDWKMEAQPARAATVWNWGSVLTKGQKTEMWQDEYGSLQAQLTDQCSNKKRYLQLKGQIKDLASARP